METQEIKLDGDRVFNFSCMIQTAGKRFIQFSQSAILYLEIKESLFNGFPEGVMILDNNTGSIDSVFTFSGDNIADLLVIYLAPKDQDDDNFKIREVFTIYNVEDIPVGEYPQGAKKIFFRNSLANELRTKKNSLTTLDFFDTNIINLSDNERAIKTGNILKKLLGKDDQPVDGVPRTGDFKINEQNWDEGKYSIFPNWCPGTETLFESIQKVFLKHVASSEPYDKCYIKYDRFKKELSLVPINKLLMFNKTDSKNFFLENLVLGTFSSGAEDQDDIQSAENIIPRPKVFLDDTLLDLSNIRAFKFFDLSSEILEKDLVINISPTIDYENTTRFDLGEKYIKDIFKDYEKYYVTDPFNHMVDSGEAKPALLWVNVRKKITTQYNKITISPYKSWDHAFDSEIRSNLLNTLLFKGMRCTMSLRGATHRTIGKFVDIEQKDNFATNKFAKVPGRWLVTECSHIIIKDKYWNSLNCVKTYRNF